MRAESKSKFIAKAVLSRRGLAIMIVGCLFSLMLCWNVLLNDLTTLSLPYALDLDKITISREGETVAAASSQNHTILIWGAPNRTSPEPLIVHPEGQIDFLRLSCDGSQLAWTAVNSEILIVRSLKSQEDRIIRFRKPGKIGKIAFSSEFTKMAVSHLDNNDSSIQIGLSVFVATASIQVGGFFASLLPFVPAEFGNEIEVWDVQKCFPLCFFGSNDSSVFGLEFSSNGKMIAIGGFEFVTVWSLDPLRPVNAFPLPLGPCHVNAISFAPKDPIIAVSRRGIAEIRILNLSTGQQVELATPNWMRQIDEPDIDGLAFCPDGSTIAVNLADRIGFWNAATLKCLGFEFFGSSSTNNGPQRIFKGLLNEMGIEAASGMAITYRKDGRLRAAAPFAQSVRLWDCPTLNK